MELRLLAAALRRRLIVILLAAAVGAAVAALFLANQQGTYRATASLLLDPLAVTTPLGQPFTGDPERYISGQMRILQGQKLAEAAAARVPGVSAAELRGSVTVSHTVGSDIVDVTAQASSPQQAQALANAVAETYVEQRRTDTAAQTAAVVDQVAKEVAGIEAALAALRGTGPAVDAQRQLQLQQLQQALDRRRSVTAPGATRDSTRVLDLAPVPTTPQLLPSAPTLAAGAAAGALLMLALAVLAEALSPRITSRRQLERLLNTSILTSFRKAGRRARRSDRLVRELMPRARTLASLVALTPYEGNRRVVSVSSVSRQAGTSSISTALAAAFAEQGSNVVLVQRRPGSGRDVLQGAEVDETPELAAVAPTSSGGPGAADRSDADGRAMTAVRASSRRTAAAGWLGQGETPLTATGWRDVSVATWSGRRPPRAEDLAALVEDLPLAHDVVVLDLPPVLDSPLSATVSPWVQDVVLLVRVPHDLERDVELAHGMLASTRPDLRLVVVPVSTPRPRSRPS